MPTATSSSVKVSTTTIPIIHILTKRGISRRMGRSVTLARFQTHRLHHRRMASAMSSRMDRSRLVAITPTRYIDHPVFGTGSRAFIWTEATGIVSMRSLVDTLGIGDDDWNEVNNARVSSDGYYILLGGTHALGSPFRSQPEHSRAVVLQLMPKSSSD